MVRGRLIFMDNFTEMTIKQLADELGVSKDKVKYQVRKLPSEFTSKKNGITYLNSFGIKQINTILGGKNSHYLSSELPTLPSDYLIKQLDEKSLEIIEKNQQIESLLLSQTNLQKLLDQQQQLQLSTQKLLEDKQLMLDSTQQELEIIKNKKWYQFWK